jgi:hypothetical protein
MFFLALHKLLCCLLFGGTAPAWLLKLHQILGWG